MTKRIDRKTLLVVLFCPGCLPQALPRPDIYSVDRGADVLCARCHKRFARWARDRMDDPSRLRAALATWVRLKHEGGLYQRGTTPDDHADAVLGGAKGSRKLTRTGGKGGGTP